MAEWLRRVIRNQIPSGSEGSSPADRESVLGKKQAEPVVPSIL